MDLQKFEVTVRCFDPRVGPESGADYVLPVDSPDAEHAISAAMSNAVAFTPKTDGDRTADVAFWATGVRRRD